MNKIDAIILWVDGSDPAWYKEFLKYTPNKIDISNDESRYRDFETVKYVFRSIEKNMPWINKIHFITYGHVPKWLNLTHPKLNFLTHKDIFKDKDNLPTFNSQAIEMNFLGIKGLADKFIYFNDDMLVLKPVAIERFFKKNLPVDFLGQGIPRRGKLYRILFKPAAHALAISHNIDVINRLYDKKQLINRNSKYYFYNRNYSTKLKMFNFLSNIIFKQYKNFVAYHHPQPYLKSMYNEVCIKAKEEVDFTCSSKFRNKDDLNQYIFRYAQLATGNFYPSEHKDHLILHIKNEETLKQCLKAIKQYTFLCINDHPNLKRKEYFAAKKKITNSLNNVLGEKSSYEK